MESIPELKTVACCECHSLRVIDEYFPLSEEQHTRLTANHPVSHSYYPPCFKNAMKEMDEEDSKRK